MTRGPVIRPVPRGREARLLADLAVPTVRHRKDTGPWFVDWLEGGRRFRLPCESKAIARATAKELRLKLVYQKPLS